MGEPVSKIITLTTDFGFSDPFVGIMKGVMLRINPSLQVVDITHQIEPYNILEAALILGSYYSYYPPGTIHVVVVDPGVGSQRRPILAWTKDYYFIAPDNGVLSRVYQDTRFQGVRELTARQYFLEEISSSFHGRDVFSPVAAWLTTGVEHATLGEKVEDYVRLDIPQPKWVAENEIQGEIVYVDRFGNLTSNISELMIRQKIASAQERERVQIWMGPVEIDGIKRFYAEGKPGELSATINSWGHLEVYLNMGNADQAMGGTKGQPIKITVRFDRSSG